MISEKKRIVAVGDDLEPTVNSNFFFFFFFFFLLLPFSFSLANRSAQSNIAMLGSDLEKKVKAAAADKEPAWDNAGKAVGVQVWRIEKFKVKAWPKEQTGTFYSGDSYIVLHTYKVPGKPDAALERALLARRAHDAGRGRHCRLQDRRARRQARRRARAVPRGAGPREPRFPALFPNGITLLEGGVDTGFTHVKPRSTSRASCTSRAPRRASPPSRCRSPATSFNEGDAFILDNGLQIYQSGAASRAGIFEKNKAASIARAIDDERAGKPQVHVCTQGADAGFPWALVGGKPAQDRPATPDVTAAAPAHALQGLRLEPARSR
jgi:gelsolin